MKNSGRYILIRYLIVGAIFSSLITSCKKIVEPARFGEFYFINETAHSITFDYNPIGSQKEVMVKYNIAANSTTLVKQTQESNETATELDFHSPFTIEYGFIEPLIIKFDGNRCLSATSDSEHTPLSIRNYMAEKLGKRKYKFTYTFKEADYNRSINCQ